ncbi:MAG: hypothetical protein COC15_01905 [Legionellales bacterium]|nr:MAG: hypothetical protein COC15_01905 [Legionellales bacterium]
MKVNAVIIVTAPQGNEGALSAFDFVAEFCTQKHNSISVFFYQDGVRQDYSTWHALQKKYNIKLHTCVAAARRRNIDSDNINLSGIGALVTACSATDVKMVGFNPHPPFRHPHSKLENGSSKYLIILHNHPNNNFLAAEALDIALGIAALEQKVSLLFSGTGTLQLLIPDSLKILAALNLYDINNIYVTDISLKNNNLHYKKLKLQPQVITSEQVTALELDNDIILSF